MSSDLTNDFNAFSRFVRRELAAGEDISLEECLRRWRRSQDDGLDAAEDARSPFETAKRLGLIGCIEHGPVDLATNP